MDILNIFYNLDQTFLSWIYSLRSPVITKFFIFITSLGNPVLIIFLVLLITVFLFLIRRRYTELIFFLAIFFSYFNVVLIKNLFERSRPEIKIAVFREMGYSFPSGHAAISLVLYGLIAYFLNKKIKNYFLKTFSNFFFGTLIFLIGFSRIYLGLHYLSDVVFGFIIGFFWLYLSIRIIEFKEYK